MDERNNDFSFDFMPFGQAIKKARESKGMTREQLSGIIGYAPRHIQSIENEGQSASISRTFLPCCTRLTPRLTAVVVFPTPPFWLVRAITLQFDIDASSFRIDLATLSRWLCKQYQRTQKSRLLLKSIRISGFVICLRHIQFSFSWTVHL